MDKFLQSRQQSLPMRTITIIVVVDLAGSPVAWGTALRGKPTSADFYRIQTATRDALGKLAMVDSRGWDRDDLRCIDIATDAEARAFDKVAILTSKVQHKLSAGACRTVMTEQVRAYRKHHRPYERRRQHATRGNIKRRLASTTPSGIARRSSAVSPATAALSCPFRPLARLRLLA